MTASEFLCLASLLCAGVPSQRSTIQRGTEHVDATLGFAVQVPLGWERIPDDEIRDLTAQLVRPGAKSPKYVAGFHVAGADGWFSYPYVLFHVMEYGSAPISSATLSESELEQLAESIAGAKPTTVLDSLSEEAKGLLSGAPEFGIPTAIAEPPGFCMNVTMHMPNVGDIDGHFYCLIGRTNAVMLCFYSRRNDDGEAAVARETWRTGFRRTPIQAVKLRAEPQGFRIDWSNAVAAGVVGAIVGGVAYLLRAKAASAANSTKVQKNE